MVGTVALEGRGVVATFSSSSERAVVGLGFLEFIGIHNNVCVCKTAWRSINRAAAGRTKRSVFPGPGREGAQSSFIMDGGLGCWMTLSWAEPKLPAALTAALLGSLDRQGLGYYRWVGGVCIHYAATCMVTLGRCGWDSGLSPPLITGGHPADRKAGMQGGRWMQWQADVCCGGATGSQSVVGHGRP